jgi:WD40 repeat protein
VRVWDAESGSCLHVLTGHENSVLSVALSPDGKRIVSGSDDNSVRIWDAEFGKCLRLLKGHEYSVRSVAISPDGKRIVSKSWGKDVRLWDTESGENLAPCPEDLETLKQTEEDHGRSAVGTILHRTAEGKELDIATLPDGGYVVLERPNEDSPWKVARAKGDYWRYVNYAMARPEGPVLWSADALGPVPEV